MARSAHQVGKNDIAVQLIGKALSIRPDYVEAHNNLGNTLKKQGRLDDAVVSYKKALSIKPDYAEAHYNLGNTFKEQGRLDDAVVSYKKALSVKPDYAEAHRALASTHKYTAHNQQIMLMENIFRKKETSDDKKMHLAFGLGKAYEDLKKFDIAFNYLLEGNKLKRETCNYSPKGEQKIFETIQKTFDVSFARKNKDKGLVNLDDTPIFILGMPRSGTSLVEQILASHPMVYGAGELDILRNIILSLPETQSLNEAFEYIARDKDVTNLLAKLGSEYLNKLRGHSATAKFITDKMPHNFRFIGLINLSLPNAKIIHCVRDPMDNCFSIFKKYFVHEHRYAYNLQELGQYYLLYQNLMRHWHNIFPEIIYDIIYEELVADQEGQTRKLLQHCKLPWNDACLSFYKTSGRVATASSAQVRKPIYEDSVQLWKRYEKQLKSLQEVLLE